MSEAVCFNILYTFVITIVHKIRILIFLLRSKNYTFSFKPYLREL